MVRIVLENNHKGDLVGFTVEGHAGLGERGRDIVCAAVSVLAQTAAAALREILHVHLQEYIQEEGSMVCRVGEMADTQKGKEVQLILRSMELGLCRTRDCYPDYIQIEYHRTAP